MMLVLAGVSVYFKVHISYKKPQSLHLVSVLYSKTSIPFLPNETVPSVPLPALYVSRAFTPLHYGSNQETTACDSICDSTSSSSAHFT